jgi:hypothetical protein
VLGVLRLDWADVASIVGVAVTPVVGYVGDLTKEQLRPNPDEVSHCFTIPLKQVRVYPNNDIISSMLTVSLLHFKCVWIVLLAMLVELMRQQLHNSCHSVKQCNCACLPNMWPGRCCSHWSVLRYSNRYRQGVATASATP